MSQVASPYGLRVKKNLGDLPFSGGMASYFLTANQTAGFFFGDPVGLQGGQPVPVTATPTATVGPNTPVGVFMGAEWQDPIRGFVNAQYFPANGISSGATKVKFKIADWPYHVFQIQADGPVVVSQVGQNAALGNFGNGSTYTGDSQVTLVSAGIGVAAAALKIVGFPYQYEPSPGAGNMPGDPFTDVLVIWNVGFHRYTAAAGL